MNQNKVLYCESAALAVVTSLCYALLNCLLKKVGNQSISPAVMIFYRELFLVLILLPFSFSIKSQIKEFFRKEVLLINLLRGMMGVLSTYLWTLGVTHMPITECVAISFMTPLLITVMAAVILKEKVSKQRWSFLALGFFGVIVVITPNPLGFNRYVVFIFGAALLWAVSTIIMKFFIDRYRPVDIVFATHCVGLLISLPGASYSCYSFDVEQVLWLFVMSLLGAVARVSIMSAYKQSSIAYIAPFDFTRLVFTAMLSYFLFGEVISIATILGAVLIVVSVSRVAILGSQECFNQVGKKGVEL